jgi:signal transduction histidine kinase
VQEALTNVRRHAGPAASATVSVAYAPKRVTLVVTDDGPAATEPAGEAGNGIAGMRARAAALGGTLTAGPVAGGGWRVEAVLPDTEESDG